MKKILIIEDSKACAFLAQTALSKFAVCEVVNCLETTKIKLQQDQNWDLILLDIELKDGSGLDFFCELQIDPILYGIPVVFVSSHSEIEKKTMAFSMGAQDYIVKPYNVAELQARVNRIINPMLDRKLYISFGQLKLSLNQLFVITKDQHTDVKIELSPKEYLLLKFLISHPNKIYSRQILLDTVWGNNINIVDRTVDSHIYSLRQKLRSLSSYICSVRGLGYQLVQDNTEFHEAV